METYDLFGEAPKCKRDGCDSPARTKTGYCSRSCVQLVRWDRDKISANEAKGLDVCQLPGCNNSAVGLKPYCSLLHYKNHHKQLKHRGEKPQQRPRSCMYDGCDKPARPRSKFCSNGHQSGHWHRSKVGKEVFFSEEVPCPNCGSTFMTIRSGNRKYCSQKCSVTYMAAERARRTVSRSPYAYLGHLCNINGRRKAGITPTMLRDMWDAQDGRCAISGIAMTWERRAKGAYYLDENVSIDKLDPSMPYAPDNIRLVCYRVNLIRGNKTDDEMVVWLEHILKGMNRNK